MLDFIGDMTSFHRYEARIDLLRREQIGSPENPTQGYFILGSIYGCALLLLNFVLNTHLCTLPAGQRDRFENYYRKYSRYDDRHTLEDENNYRLEFVAVPAGVPSVILILGGVLASAGKSDFLTLYIISKIQAVGIQIQIILDENELFGILTRKLVETGLSNTSLSNEEYFHNNSYLTFKNAQFKTGNLERFWSTDYLLHHSGLPWFNFSNNFKIKYTELFLNFLKNVSLIQYLHTNHHIWYFERNYVAFLCMKPVFRKEIFVSLLRMLERINRCTIQNQAFSQPDFEVFAKAPKAYIFLINNFIRTLLRFCIASPDDPIMRQPPYQNFGALEAARARILDILLGQRDFNVLNFLREKNTGNPADHRTLNNLKCINIFDKNVRMEGNPPCINLNSNYGKPFPLLSAIPPHQYIPLRARETKICGIHTADVPNSIPEFIFQIILNPSSFNFRLPRPLKVGMELEIWGVVMDFNFSEIEVKDGDTTQKFSTSIGILGSNEPQGIRNLWEAVAGLPIKREYIAFINQTIEEFRRDATKICEFSLYRQLVEILDNNSIPIPQFDDPSIIWMFEGESIPNRFFDTMALSIDHAYMQDQTNAYVIPEFASHPSGPGSSLLTNHPRYFEYFVRFGFHIRELAQQRITVQCRVTPFQLCKDGVEVTLNGTFTWSLKDHEPFRLYPQFTFPVSMDHFAPRNPRIAVQDCLIETLSASATWGDMPKDRILSGSLLEIPMPAQHWDAVILIFARSLVKHLTNQIVRRNAESYHWYWVDGTFVFAIWAALILCMGSHGGKMSKNLWTMMPKTNPRVFLIALFLKDNAYYQNFLTQFKIFLEGGARAPALSQIFEENLQIFFQDAAKTGRCVIMFDFLKAHDQRIANRLAINLNVHQLEGHNDLNAIFLAFAFLLSALPNRSSDSIRTALNSQSLNVTKITNEIKLMMDCFGKSSRILVSAQPNLGEAKFETRAIDWFTTIPASVVQLSTILKTLTAVGNPIVPLPKRFEGAMSVDTKSTLSQADSTASSRESRHDAQWVWFPQYSDEDTDERRRKRVPRRPRTRT